MVIEKSDFLMLVGVGFLEVDEILKEIEEEFSERVVMVYGRS